MRAYSGALDVWLTPIIMKKGRPATQVSVLALAAHRMRLENILIEQSTTLGVRGSQVDRVKAARRVEAVVTRWGDIRIKLRVWQGRVIDAMPEYDDCRAIATANDLPIRLVWNEAHQLGQSHVGRRLGDQLVD